MKEPVIRVRRYAYEPDCTLGTIRVEGTQFECYSLELPWLFNAVGKSCILEGEYRAKVGTHRSPKGSTEESVELLEVPGRTEIEIHIANKASQLRGCIAPGLRLGVLNGERAVLESRNAHYKLLEALLAAVGNKSRSYPEQGWGLRVIVENDLSRFRARAQYHPTLSS